MFPSRHTCVSRLAGLLTPSSLGVRRQWTWSVEREPQHRFASAGEIIDEGKITSLLESTKKRARDPACVSDILRKAFERSLLRDTPNPTGEYVQGLTLEDTATLLNTDPADESIMNELFSTALRIKERIYGNRIVLFAPLYIANYCVNGCTYCAFRSKNACAPRSVLTTEELKAEVEALQKIGHRRLLLLTGESPKYSFDQFIDAIHTVAEVKSEPNGDIRRINVEIPSLSVSDFRRLHATNEIGTYTLFQETYHRGKYEQVHPSGPKADYDHRLLTMDRAQTAGIDDVGIGALFGLHDFRFEVMGLLMHAQHLDRAYGAGPHTISIPRMQAAEGAPDALHPPAPVDDLSFKKLVAVIRCAVPYTGMILSTRESPEMRRDLLRLGVSQMSAGSRTAVGSYYKGDAETEEIMNTGQFSLQDHRSLDEVVRDLMEHGFVPSWCTACYRKGRTGQEFMKIAKRGDICNFCHPNALLTLREYLDDYASEATRVVGSRVAEEELAKFPNERVQKEYKKKLDLVLKGKRDLYF